MRNNPKKPYEVKVPNKIRKRIFMRERDEPELKLLPKVLTPALTKNRGSMWSRFVNKVKKFFNSLYPGGGGLNGK